jgi:GT2 family glycosyltransferase
MNEMNGTETFVLETIESFDAARLKIVVGIATSGRREILSHTIGLLARQTRLPDYLIVCPANSDDVDASVLARFPAPTAIVTGALGSSAQRNRILFEAIDADIVVFFDDDYFGCIDYLARIEQLFTDNPDVVAATGRPLEDGATGPGLSVEHALAAVSNAKEQPPGVAIEATYGAYGCNMAFRLHPVRNYAVLFDENLPLYGWQEDIDFSRSLAPHGRIVQYEALRGVHLGNKRGRTSGVRFGYSQVANPVYLVKKGTLSSAYARPMVIRNIFANLLRFFWPEAWVDRKGRLRGNILALIDIARGRVTPSRILTLR